jgi:hypothetical protein
MSRRKKAPNFTDMEEKYLTPNEETEAERTRRKSNKRKALSCFNAEISRQADDEVQAVRELNTVEEWIIRQQNTRRRAKRRAEVTPGERILAG